MGMECATTQVVYALAILVTLVLIAIKSCVQITVLLMDCAITPRELALVRRTIQIQQMLLAVPLTILALTIYVREMVTVTISKAIVSAIMASMETFVSTSTALLNAKSMAHAIRQLGFASVTLIG